MREVPSLKWSVRADTCYLRQVNSAASDERSQKRGVLGGRGRFKDDFQVALLRSLQMGARFLFAISWLCMLPAVAQTAGGSYTLSGTVTDQSGASIPGAVVSARQRGNSRARTAATDATGSFRING